MEGETKTPCLNLQMTPRLENLDKWMILFRPRSIICIKVGEKKVSMLYKREKMKQYKSSTEFLFTNLSRLI